MRLEKVKKGQGLKAKLIFHIGSRVLMRQKAPDVLRMLMYRPEHFGAKLNPLTQDVMRGPSEWSVGERELFAAFVSLVNQCPF